MPVTAGRPGNKDALSEGRATEATLRSFGGLLGRGTMVIFGKQLYVFYWKTSVLPYINFWVHY